MHYDCECSVTLNLHLISALSGQSKPIIVHNNYIVLFGDIAASPTFSLRCPAREMDHMQQCVYVRVHGLTFNLSFLFLHLNPMAPMNVTLITCHIHSNSILLIRGRKIEFNAIELNVISAYLCYNNIYCSIHIRMCISYMMHACYI